MRTGSKCGREDVEVLVPTPLMVYGMNRMIVPLVWHQSYISIGRIAADMNTRTMRITGVVVEDVNRETKMVGVEAGNPNWRRR